MGELGPSVFNPNDAVADGKGGVYFTASGAFDLDAPKQGHILYLSPDREVFILERALHYANGVTVAPDGSALFVSEHLARRILRYPILEPGVLGDPAVFANLSNINEETEISYERWGPDGLEFDDQGLLHVALYGAGTLVILAADGEALHQVAVPLKLLTNVAFSDEGRRYLTGTSYSPGRTGTGSLMRTMGSDEE